MKSFKISIKRSAFLILILTAAFSIFSLSALWIYTEVTKSKKMLSINKEKYETQQKEYIKNEVYRVVELINFTRSTSLDKTEQEIKDDILGYITKIRLKYGGYIFVNSYVGKALVFDGVKIIGEKDITNMTDPDGLRLFDIELECANTPGGDYFYYKFKRLDSFTPVPKLSYATGYDDWEWIIGAGIYLDDLGQFLQNQKNQTQAVLYRKVLYIALLFFVLLLIIFAVTNYVTVFLKNQIGVFTSFFANSQDEESMIQQKDLRVMEFKSLAHSVNIMIHQQRLAEKLIKKERDKARGYLQVAGVIILALDKDGYVTLINKKGCSILGYKEEDIIGKNWFHHFIPITHKQQLYDRFRKIMESRANTLLNKESLIITASGEEHNILWQNTLLLDEYGQANGTLSSGLDITERKKVEANFIESEEKYKLLFEKSSDPVLILGEGDTYIDCNNAALEILGYNDKSELIGIHPAQISPEFQPDGQSSYKKGNAIISAGRKFGFQRFEWVHIDVNNNPFDVDISITEIPISGTRYLYVVWRNITENKRQEKELLIAKDKAEQGDIIKTSFLHNMQHEIRTPLNAIMGFTQLLKQQDFDKNERDGYYKDILSSGGQLSKIIDKIIDFARLQSGNVYISNDKVELKRFICDIYVDYCDEIQSKKINLELSVDNNKNTSLVITDYHKIKEIIGHLIDNAQKFTEEGSIKLSYVIEEPNIIFKVSDTGVGIDKKHFESIFGKFNRPTPQSSEKIYGGNGLGLSISKAVLEHLDGSIEVDSVVGVGSTFTFSIPYYPVNTEIYINKKNLFEKVIIVITESKSKFKKLSSLVKPHKVQIKRISSGIETIEYLQGNFPADLLLVDTDLQNMNSVTTTKGILTFKKNLPIIALVSKDRIDATTIGEALTSGCVNFIGENESEEETLLIISSSLV